MDSVLMRTMTEKSIIGFGYEDVRDLSVGQMIAMRKVSDLIRMYYGLDKINFVEDILDQIGITKEIRILKPGKIPSQERGIYIKKALDNYYSNKSETEVMADAARKKGNRSKRSKAGLSHVNKLNSNYSLTRKNHGHK